VTSSRSLIAVWFSLVAAALAAAGPAWAARGDTTLLSRANGSGGAKANTASSPPAISADGRFAAFYSPASNLTIDDRDPVDDVFVRRLTTGRTVLVSRASGPFGAKGNRGSFDPVLSADGRFVAFESEASNLTPDDPDEVVDVFVRDLVTGGTTLVSRATGIDGAKANAGSYVNSVSADGRYVAFESEAGNLSAADDDALRDVFVRDRREGTTILVSRASGARGTDANGNSYGGSISADGDLVAFESAASNVDDDAEAEPSNVYLRDLRKDETTLVSRARGEHGDAGNKGSYRPSLSADGRFLAFSSYASNLAVDDADIIEDVFVRDLRAHETVLASRATGEDGAKGTGGSTRPSLSEDGRFIAFDSFAANLTSDDGDKGTDVFVRDLAKSETTLASRAAGAEGTKGNQASLSPSLSGDGRFVAFVSFASNLSRADRDTLGDSYLRDVRGAPPRCAEITRRTEGTDDDDMLTGDDDGDLMLGLGGDDRVSGLDGGDCLFGGAGDDTLVGQERGDDLRGGPGNDVLDGGDGGDQLYGGPGVNSYRAGTGDDSVFASNRRAERIDCGRGLDEVRADRADRVRGCERVTRVRR
jgi:Tol biopolymer transport system component